MPLSVDRSLTKAKALASRGSVAEAQALYDEVLAQYPNNQRARTGRIGLADPSLTEPRTPVAQKALSNALALQRAGQLDEAEAAAQRVVAEHPSAKAYFVLGGICFAREEMQNAADAFARAVQLQPTFAMAYNNLGNALFRQGQYENAALAYNEALKHDDTLVKAYNNLGTAFLRMKRYEPALRCLDTAIEIDPDFAQAYNNRGLVLRELGRSDEALGSLETALRLKPDAAEVLTNLSGLMRVLDRHHEAIECLEKLLEQNPNLVEAHINMGVAYNDLGDFEAAKESYRKALAACPDSAYALYNLSTIERYQTDHPDVAAMRALLEREPSDDESLHLHFALGKVAADCGDIDDAFHHFTEGNSLRKKLHPYDRSTAVRVLEAIQARSEALEPLVPESEAKYRPIFIVGMPRSGTTLVEQILASHSAVHGGGEMTDLARIGTKALQEKRHFDAETLASIRQDYLDCLERIGTTSPVITDKLPANFKWTGIIAAALPEAKVIDVRRDPRATCWSIFRRYFTVAGNDYAYDQVDIADYYGLYSDMMAVWNRRLPGWVHTLDYERLTEDQEGETRRLLDYCGLPFEEACLEFHRSKRAVTTASAAQVRRGLYKGSSESWRAYEAHLGPMLDKLVEVGAI